ncbi:Holliday junction branch migration protein RuvA [Lignipirellula cremea]|uniref:Holliday junction branch migration protein RuvA n=1 Tax=Lignipirellula cremea TaxID=2528010 RepID=UPI0011A93E48|nr:Holliday junction branch migration protein RuvA [Lignipirellula cremea]
MITKISAKLLAVTDDQATFEVDAFEYQVLICEYARRQLQLRMGEIVSLHTIQYLEGNPAQGRLTPRLVGFLSSIEREFFELFCSVDGVGVKKALRAMVRPVQEVAALIEAQDAKGLSTLPGIGAATSERVIAKLRRKMPKFALMVATDAGRAAEAPSSVVEDTFQVLLQLGHSESDARKLLDGALAEKKKYKDVESLIQAVYQNTNPNAG